MNYPARATLRAVFWSTPRPLRHLLRDRLLPASLAVRIQRAVEAPPEAPDPDTARAAALDHRLWGGFSTPARADLEALLQHPATSPAGAARAAWALARWHFAQGDTERALERVTLARLADRANPNRKAQTLLESDCLVALARREAARAVIAHACERERARNPHLMLAMANTCAPEDEAGRLEWINRVLADEGIAPVGKADPDAPLELANLATAPVCGLTPPAAQPRVSVLLPAFAAEETLHIALDSLLAQSWHNLEIIIVDDASPDATFDRAAEYAARDARVTALRQPVNRGAYPARNLALRHATGDFVTVHDADDWSHPLKIEIQARHLMTTPDAPANVTDWVRSTPALSFRGTVRPTELLVQMNHSALMLRRATLEALSGWDPVRVAADSDLIRRLEAAHGADAVHRLAPGVPLSFALEAESLTRQGATHMRTIHHGVRREYHAASRHWLETCAGTDAALPASGRAFPAPRMIHPDRPGPIALDMLFVHDFNAEGPAWPRLMAHLAAARAQGLRCGVFHWPRYESDVAAPLCSELRTMAQAGQIHIVTPGEALAADTVITGAPNALTHAIDLPPQITCARAVVLADTPAEEPARISANAAQVFGTAPVWAPVSAPARAALEMAGGHEPLHIADWLPPLDTETLGAGAAPGGAWPVIGRHGRDHPANWPDDPAALRAAYCANGPCDVRLMGGAAHALARLETVPANWRVQPFGAQPVADFLAGLDLFVHYPRADTPAGPARAVIEAMAAGVPVMLPPEFAPVFGAAALYGAPDEVAPLAAQLHADPAARAAHAAAGRAFVETHCSLAAFARRIDAIAPT